MLLAGGLLAQGVRPAVSREDYLYERAGHYYFFAKTFGWTDQQVDALRPWLRQRLPEVHAISEKIAEERREADRRADAQAQNGR